MTTDTIPAAVDRPARTAPSTAAQQPDFALVPPHAAHTMAVTKRDGRREPVDVGKIVRAVQRCSDGLDDIDPMRVALKTIAGMGVTVTSLSAAEREAFVKATRPVYDKWKATVGADLVTAAERAIAARKK